MDQAVRSAKGGLRSLRHFFWPARSLLQQHPQLIDAPFSVEDYQQLTFLNGAGCPSCARKIETDHYLETACAACLTDPPLWRAARAALVYDDVTAKIILRLKHAGQREGLKVLCNWMSSAGADILENTDWVMPVPLHYQRLARRGFNQSAWLAQGVARHSGTLLLLDGLRRLRPTPSQAGLTARQRKTNVAGAFEVRPNRAGRIKGATITLVDDVYTTGSTLEACTRTLLNAGAAEVNILVLARVVREVDVTI